jgi:hypothetical protein
MSKEIFDQANLKDPKAQRFADAFEGCGEWITPPSSSQESSLFDFRRHEPSLDLPRSRSDVGRSGLDRAA